MRIKFKEWELEFYSGDYPYPTVTLLTPTGEYNYYGVTCPACGGKGMYYWHDPYDIDCDLCYEEGTVWPHTWLKFKIQWEIAVWFSIWEWWCWVPTQEYLDKLSYSRFS